MTNTLTKIVHPGAGPGGEVFCKIVIRGQNVFICGVVAPEHNGMCRQCGQIQPLTIGRFSPGWNLDNLSRFNAIWMGFASYDDFRAEFNVLYDHAKYPAVVNTSQRANIIAPQEAIDFLTNLPDTDIQPIWI